MASMTMAATLMGGAMTKSPSTSRRGVIVAKASEGERGNLGMKKEEGSSGRRDLVFAGVAVAACTLAKMAMAQDEPKNGTPEAKKKYNAVCVTMPTARVCRK